MSISLRVLEPAYTYDHRLAACDGCSLRERRDDTECLSQWPKKFNGLAIVGEGPGPQEARLKVPFIGPSGQLLNAILTQVGIKREECFVGNATSCLPPRNERAGKSFVDRHPDAIHRCRPRLLTELQHLKPRVILALGAGALHTLVGDEQIHNRWVDNPCERCNGQRKWKRFGCSRCKHVFMGKLARDGKGNKLDKPEGSPCEVEEPPEACARDPKKTGKWQPRWVVCEGCNGKKRALESSKTFLCDHKISFVAGSVFRASTLPIGAYFEDPEHVYIIPTLHPAYLLRKATNKRSAAQKQHGGQYMAAVVLRHVEKACRLLTEDPVWEEPWERVDEPIRILDWADKAKARGQFVSVDIETEADKDTGECSVFEASNITCIGFATPELDVPAMVVDTDSLPTDHPRVQAVLKILADRDLLKVMHNGVYDAGVIERLWEAWVYGWAADTLLLHHAVAPDEPHKLHHVGFTYTDTPPWKPPRKKSDKFVFETKEELHQYNARDCKVTAFAAIGLRREAEAEKARFIADLDLKKFKLAVHMRKAGLPVDRMAMLEVGAESQFKQEQALRALRDITGRVPAEIRTETMGRDFNPHSIRQLQWALFGQDGPLKLVPKKFTDPSPTFPNGQPSTDSEALLAHLEQPFVQALISYRKYKHIKDAYVDGAPLQADGRLHPEWVPTKVTGRWGSKPNTQNWEDFIKSMILCAPGRKIVGADASQLEMRIMALLSDDADLIRRCKTADEGRKLEPDYDPHSYVTSNFFGESFTRLRLTDEGHDPEKDKHGECACDKCTRKKLRWICKTVFYALGYGGGASTVHQNIYKKDPKAPPLSVSDVERAVETIFSLFPGMREYQQRMLVEAERTGKVTDVLIGRSRIFPLKQPDATVCLNHPIQSTAASYMDVALWNFFCELPSVDPTAVIIAQVHDAIYVECAEDKAELVGKLLEKHMSVELRLPGGSQWMPLLATAHIADNWRDAT